MVLSAIHKPVPLVSKSLARFFFPSWNSLGILYFVWGRGRKEKKREKWISPLRLSLDINNFWRNCLSGDTLSQASCAAFHLAGYAKISRPWLLLMRTVSPDCVCNKKPWQMRSCISLGQRTSMLNACYKMAGFPNSVFLSMAWESTWALHIRLGRQGEMMQINMMLMLLAVLWVIKSFVSDPEVSDFC